MNLSKHCKKSTKLAKFSQKYIWHLLWQRFEVNIMNVCLTFYFLWFEYQNFLWFQMFCYWTEKENEIGPIWYFMSIPTWGGRKHESVYRYNKTFSIYVIMKNVVSWFIQHYWTRNNENFIIDIFIIIQTKHFWNLWAVVP